MRDLSHRAAATLTLGLMTDDLFGALMEAPSMPATDDTRTAFVEFAAATHWLGELDRDAGRARIGTPRSH